MDVQTDQLRKAGYPHAQLQNDLEATKTSGDPQRGKWGRSLEFLMSCVSMSVGLGNVWRFPNAAYTNGGGAFLIPYLILLFLIGRPLYYMELVLGQFSGLGPIKVWKCVPGMKGIGYAQLISTAYLTIFYNYLIAVSLHFMFSSMQGELPWANCHDSWFTEGNCSTYIKENVTDTNETRVSAPELYWRHRILHQSEGLWEVSYINWELVLCLLLAWSLLYLTLIKGVESLGKVTYFTAVFPYTVLIALLVVACSQPGALEGVKNFFRPEWGKLLDMTVWYRACEQSFFSLAVGYGCLVMYSSYNDFRNNVNRDAVILAVLDTFTSVLAGCVVFAVLGSLSKKLNVDFNEVVGTSGADLAYIAYPEALANIEFVPQLWSVLFFFMLFTLGIGSSIAQVETILTAIRDRFPRWQKKKWLLALIMCTIFFLCGLPLTTDAGQYMLKLLDNYGVGTAVFFYATLETVSIMWIYGLNNFCADVKFMLESPVGIFWKVTWAVSAPILLIVIFIYGNILIGIEGNTTPGVPKWGNAIGWVLAIISISQIPFWSGLVIYRSKGQKLTEKIYNAFQHSNEWGPRDPKLKEEWLLTKKRIAAGSPPSNWNPTLNGHSNLAYTEETPEIWTTTTKL